MDVMYRFIYMDKHGCIKICYYADIESTVRTIEKKGGKVIEISEV